MGELTALPQTSSLDLRGLLLRQGRGGKRGGDERGGDEGEERGRGRGKWRRGEGREARGGFFLVMWPRMLSALNPHLYMDSFCNGSSDRVNT